MPNMRTGARLATPKSRPDRRAAPPHHRNANRRRRLRAGITAGYSAADQGAGLAGLLPAVPRLLRRRPTAAAFATLRLLGLRLLHPSLRRRPDRADGGLGDHAPLHPSALHREADTGPRRAAAPARRPQLVGLPHRPRPGGRPGLRPLLLHPP